MNIASDLSYECLQKRRRERELTTPLLNERFGVTHLLVQRPAIREALIGAKSGGVDEATWDRLRLQRKFEQ